MLMCFAEEKKVHASCALAFLLLLTIIISREKKSNGDSDISQCRCERAKKCILQNFICVDAARVRCWWFLGDLWKLCESCVVGLCLRARRSVCEKVRFSENYTLCALSFAAARGRLSQVSTHSHNNNNNFCWFSQIAFASSKITFMIIFSPARVRWRPIFSWLETCCVCREIYVVVVWESAAA